MTLRGNRVDAILLDELSIPEHRILRVEDAHLYDVVTQLDDQTWFGRSPGWKFVTAMAFLKPNKPSIVSKTGAEYLLLSKPVGKDVPWRSEYVTGTRADLDKEMEDLLEKGILRPKDRVQKPKGPLPWYWGAF